MSLIYNLLIHLVQLVLPIVALFNSKIKEFVKGRKEVFSSLRKHFSKKDKVYWFHTASLGEYEQAIPVILAIKEKEPERKILISFFSPSGYRVKKGKSPADLEVYLPLDTKKNAKYFFDAVHVEKAFFIKYEIWPNFLAELHQRKIKTYLISGLFRKNQLYFNAWGGFFRKALSRFDYFFVQTNQSKELLNSIGFENVTISGDTRYDRVSQQLEMDNQLDFVENFLGEQLCFVFGSSWPEDEAVFIDYVNSNKEIKFIIAPHEISESNIRQLQKKIKTTHITYSNYNQQQAKEANVLILDTVGYLSKVYAYADIAYVGGGMGTSGLHNILEPATFGVPILIGKNFSKFPEAKELQTYAGLFSVEDSNSFNEIAHKLVTEEKFRQQTGMIVGHFIQARVGATEKIMEFIGSYD